MEKKLFDLFDGKGELLLVGGCVRDRLLGRVTNDLDFATNLTPDETEALLKSAGYRTHDIGKTYGTISVILEDGTKSEITTYRKDEHYARDNRRPLVTWGTKIEEDLIRRDFTFNSLAIGKSGEVINLFNGVEHLKLGIIATPLDAKETFSDDPLRILRAVRFRSRFGFTYSDNVKSALASQAYRILYLPRERILDELNKILLGDYVKEALEDLLDYKILNYVIPELTVLKNLNQESKFHHKDVWGHTVQVVANTPADLTLRWSAVLHDVAKPYVFSSDENSIHFYRHEDLGSKIARGILERSGAPRKLIEDVTYLVREHMKANLYSEYWSDSAVRRFIRETGSYVDVLLKLSEADITSHNPTTVEKHLRSLEDLKRRIEELKNFKTLQCPISGDVIMKYFNLPTGPKVGAAKELIMNALTNGELTLELSNEEYLKYLEGKL